MEQQSKSEQPGNSDFALTLYRTLSAADKNNVFISPYSISSALGMLLLGSKENTATELKQALQHGALTDTNMYEQNLEIMLKFLQLESITLETASKLFPEKSFSVSEDFNEKCQKYYRAKTESLNFAENPEDSREAINRWVEEQTKGKITDFLPGGSITNSTKLVLANAIYFKGDWLRKFNEAETHDVDFFVDENQTKKVTMMTQQRFYKFAKDEELGVDVVELPYKNENFSMLLLVPTERFGLQALEESLTAAKLKSITSYYWSMGEIILELPRMKFEYEVDLVSHLKQLGVNDVFDAAKANLTGLSEAGNLHVSGAYHKAVIEVNEEGSEVAPGMVRIVRLPRHPPQRVVCDHPFMFIIRHIPTSSILFVGKFVSP